MPTPPRAHLPRLSEALRALDADGLRRRRRTVTPLPRGRCRVGDRVLWNFTTNDYLDLAGDARLVDAARAALETHGVGARASALVSGRSEWHERLEERLARFEDEPAAVLFPTGYAANVGTITALVGVGDAVFCDRLNHASLVDGCRLSGARLRVYRHDRLDRLERELGRATETRTRLIVTDGMFSMDGTLAPLPDLCDLAERFDAAVLVDEAHGTGVFGKHGRGVSERLGVADRVAVRVGTLSKALGTLGGFACGSRELVDWLWNRARPQIYSTALPPAVCAAAVAAIDVVESEPRRRERLAELADHFRTKLTDHGVEAIPGSVGPIVPIVVGEAENVVETARRLEEAGFLVSAIRPPTVPRGTARLRISLTCAHDESVLDELASAVRNAVTVGGNS